MPRDPKMPNERWYTTELKDTDADNSVEGEAIRTITFDVPGMIKRVRVGVVGGDGEPIPVSAGLPFKIRFEWGTGDRIMTQATLADALDWPLDPSPCWKFNPGSRLIVGITPLRPSLTIQVSCKTDEMLGRGHWTATEQG